MADGVWSEYKRQQKNRRKDRLPDRTAEIGRLKSHGIEVLRLTAYQFRIGGRFDLYPTHRRVFDMETKTWGDYKDPREFVGKLTNTKGGAE